LRRGDTSRKKEEGTKSGKKKTPAASTKEELGKPLESRAFKEIGGRLCKGGSRRKKSGNPGTSEEKMNDNLCLTMKKSDSPPERRKSRDVKKKKAAEKKGGKGLRVRLKKTEHGEAVCGGRGE